MVCISVEYSERQPNSVNNNMMLVFVQLSLVANFYCFFGKHQHVTGSLIGGWHTELKPEFLRLFFLPFLQMWFTCEG